MLFVLILQYYAVFVLFTFVTYLLGKIIRNTLQLRTFFFTDIFYCLLLGSITLSTLQSIWFTNGETVQIIFCLIGVIYFWHLKKNEIPQQIHNRYATPKPSYYIPILFIGSVLIYTWEAYFLFKEGSFNYLLPRVDIVFYAKIAECLGEIGIENPYRYYNLLVPSTNHLELYHYFTLWNTNLVTKIFGGFAINNYILVVVNQLVFSCFIAILGFWEKANNNKPNLFEILLSFLFLFLNTTLIPFYKDVHFLRHINEFYFPLFDVTGKKISYYYVFFLAFLHLSIHKRYTEAMLTVTALIVATVAAMPSIGGGAVVVIVVWHFINKENKKVFFLRLLSVSIVVLSLLVISKLWGNSGNDRLPVREILDGLFDIGKFKTYFNVIVGSNIQLLVVYFPYILFIIILYKLNHYKLALYDWFIFIFIFCITQFGLGIWAVLMSYPDSFQLFMLTALPLWQCSLILFSIKVIAQLTNKYYRIIAYVIIFLLLDINFYNILSNHYPTIRQNIYSDSYLLEIQKNIKKEEHFYTVGIIPNLKNDNCKSCKSPFYEIMGAYMSVMTNNKYACIWLGDLDIPESIALLKGGKPKDNFEHHITKGLFFNLLKKEKIDFDNLDLRIKIEMQLKFIKQQNFKFLIISKGVDSTPFEYLAKKKIIDSISGEIFLVL